MRLVAVSSTNKDVRELVGSECEVYPDWRSLVERFDIQAVFIAVPPRLHVEMTEAFVTAGISVFVEKPMCLSVDDGQRILEVVERRQGHVHVDHIDLFNPALVAARNLGKSAGQLRRVSGRIGASYDRRSDISPLWEYAPHFIAVCLDMLGTPAKISATKLRPEPPFADDPQRSLVRLVMTFADGTEADLIAGNAMNKKSRTLTFEFERSRIVFNDQADHKLVVATPDDGQEIPVDVPDIRPLTASIRAFESDIRRHETSKRNVRAALEVINVLEHASKAIGEPLPNSHQIDNPQNNGLK